MQRVGVVALCISGLLTKSYSGSLAPNPRGISSVGIGYRKTPRVTRTLSTLVRCFENKTPIKMMPMKEILNQRQVPHLPPVLVVDETTLKCSDDLGPICGCDEKYDIINRYKPFLPGAVNPYKKRDTSDTECLQLFWKRLPIGEQELIFDKPIALHPSQISEKLKPPKQTEISMFTKPHKYTDCYIMEKLKQCPREHTDECSCHNK